MQIGYGDKWAEESKLTLSGANNEEMMSSNLFRAEGIISREDMQYSDNSMNLFHQGGGLNLRGYNGYLSPDFNNNGDVSF